MVETLWLREFRLLLGATAPAVSATLVAFFAGQALGAAWGGRLAARSPRPLAVYGKLELGAGLAAAAVPAALWLLRGVVDDASDALREWPAALVALRFAAALVAAAPAGVFFGATLPPLVASCVGSGVSLGRAGATLLCANTLGAATGAALASFLLPEWLGVRLGYGLGILALVLAGGLGWIWAGGAEPGTQPPKGAPARPSPERDRTATGGLSGGALLALAGASGVAVFACQPLLVQAFARVLNQSTYAFGVVLVTVLVALGAAAGCVAVLARRLDARTLLAWAAVAAAIGWAAFPMVFVDATEGLSYWGSEEPWPGYLWSAFGLALRVAGLPLFASGLLFPALLHAAGRTNESPANAAATTGRLLAVNTAGAVLGALLAPYLLLPGLGLWLAFTAVAILYGIAAIAIPATAGQSRLWRDCVLGLAWMLVLSRGSPASLPALHLEADDRLLFSEETPAGLVAVVERRGGRFIQTDNHYALGGSADRVHQERQGHVPLLLHPAPKRALFLGSATGGSAGAALAHPVEELTLVELTPGVARAAGFFSETNRGVYDAPPTRVVLDDARSFLRSTGQRFDVVVADLFVPWRAGTGSLYSEAHFRAALEHLTEGGLFCQWLPLYQLSEPELAIVAATFQTVFPDALVFRGDFYGRFPIVALIGWRGSPPHAASIDARITALAQAGEDDRWVTHPDAFWSLYIGRLGARTWKAPINTDDHPHLEFVAARSHAGGERGKLDPIVGPAWVRIARQLREVSLASPVPFPGLGEAARRAGDGGHALQAAGALFSIGNHNQAGQAMAVAAELLPQEVFAEAEADPTASDVWQTQ
ncbi:MAG: hypothetical protein GY946_09215 [bacterium]|nr:hypothetical protein [bacterium]